MKKIPLLVVTSCAVMLGLSGCTSREAQMEAQLMQHDAQLRQMQPVQADAWNQVQALRDEVQELRGQIADLRKVGGAAVIVDKLNRHDQALQQIGTSMAINLDLGAPLGGGANPSTAATAPMLGAEPQPSATLTPATAQSAQATYGGLVPATTPVAANTPSGSTWGQATPQPKKREAPKDVATALYESGINAFNSRNYSSAERSFRDFVTNFGSHAKVADAQYYLAECYFQKNQFPDAAVEYDVIITKYPNSSRAPGAYLKQGISFSKMKNKQASRERMNELIKKYPNSPEAARAKTFLKTNK